MKKKFLALVLTLAMVLSLVPVTALAVDETSGTTTNDVVYGHYDGSTWTEGAPARTDGLKDTVTTVNKTAKKVDGQDNQYEVTLKVEMKHKTTEVQPGAAATVLVIDKSGSMSNNNRLPAAKTAAINFLKSYSGFSDSNFNKNGSLKNNVSDKNLKRYVSLVTFNDSASLQTWGEWNNQESWIDVSTKAGYQKLVSAINEIWATGGTNLDDALRLAKSQMQSDSIKQIEPSKKNVIALTDGVPTCYVKETWLGTNSVSQHGGYGCPDTNAATTRSADALKEKVNAVYTVCFGAANDRCWTKGSAHAWFGLIETEWHTIDGPTVGDFLKDNIATKEQYAYNADDANGLYGAFAAITQTITDGLNEGVVTDGLPAGVTDVKGSGFATTWTLDSSSVTPTTSNGYNVYTYTKTYRVNVDPAAVSTVKVGEVNYAPLNTLTTLTVQHNGSPVEIHFPIPAIRINITQATVTFKVKNGTWSDGETGDKTTTVTMINGKGTLPTSAVPTGMEANPNYEGGEWDTIPNTEANGITDNVTYTYSFVPKKVEVNLSDLIKKELTVKKNSTLPDNTTFTVKVTPTTTGDQGTQTDITGTTTNKWENGTTDTATGDTTYMVPFIFDNDGTLSLPAGTYTYTVQETKGNISGMQYDSEEYTLTITVPGDGEAPYQATPITIKNTYQTPDLIVTKQTYKVNGVDFKSGETVAHVGEQIVWEVSVKNNKTTQAFTQLKDTLGGVTVYSDKDLKNSVTLTDGSWTATVPAEQTVTYYVTYIVKEADIPNGKIVNTIVKDGDNNNPINSDPVSTWDTKQLKSATSLNTSNWTTTVTLTLPTVNGNKAETTVTTDSIIVNRMEVQPIIAISNGSYVIDQIGNEFTFMDGLSLKVNGTELPATQDTTNKNLYRFGTETGGVYPYTVTYTAKNDETKEPAQFTWNINEDVYAGTEVTLSYKLKLTTPKTATGTYGVEDLNGNGQIDQNKALYTNESATLYKDKQEIAVFPKPSVSYTIKGSSGGHGGGTVTIPDDVPTGLNGKDHYAYVVGYPDGMVYPQKNITRAEVATIFFRLLEDETREANMTKSNSYNDMKEGAWYTCAVSTLSKMGIIKGYEDGSFKPDASISRAEFAAIAARFDPDGDKTPATFSDVSSHWAKDEISIAANHGWIKGYEDGSFKPDQKITRAETMTLVNRVLKRLPETKDDLHKDMKTWPDNQNESAWFYLAVQEATNSHYQKLKKDGTHEKWESMRETRDWAALEK